MMCHDRPFCIGGPIEGYVLIILLVDIAPSTHNSSFDPRHVESATRSTVTVWVLATEKPTTSIHFTSGSKPSLIVVSLSLNVFAPVPQYHCQAETTT